MTGVIFAGIAAAWLMYLVPYFLRHRGEDFAEESATEIPFTPLAKPLSESRIGVITTTSLWTGQDHLDLVDRPPKHAYAAPCDPLPERMFTMDLAWDKEATNTDDLGSFLPVTALKKLAAEGRIRDVSPRFYGVPTEYSQRKTKSQDAPAVLEFLREDGVDATLLVGL